MAHAFLKGPSSTRKWWCSKARFESRRQANIALRHTVKNSRGLVAMGDGTMNVYKCRECGGYHLGHGQAKKRKEKR